MPGLLKEGAIKEEKIIRVIFNRKGVNAGTAKRPYVFKIPPASEVKDIKNK